MKPISRQQIITAFEALADELGSAEPPHELIIVGGAAVVLLYDARESTRDVDVLQADRRILDAAATIAQGLDLPKNWLNDGAKGFVHGVSVGDSVFASSALVVRSLAPHQLLAMKLSARILRGPTPAWRDDVDIEDARLLLTKVTGTKMEIWRLVEQHLVPGRELKASYAFEDLWEAEYGS